MPYLSLFLLSVENEKIPCKITEFYDQRIPRSMVTFFLYIYDVFKMIIKSLHCKPAVNFLFTSSTHICTPIAEGLTKSLASPERIFIHHKVSCVRNFTKCEQDSRSIYIHSMFLLIQYLSLEQIISSLTKCCNTT